MVSMGSRRLRGGPAPPGTERQAAVGTAGPVPRRDTRLAPLPNLHPPRHLEPCPPPGPAEPPPRHPSPPSPGSSPAWLQPRSSARAKAIECCEKSEGERAGGRRAEGMMMPPRDAESPGDLLERGQCVPPQPRRALGDGWALPPASKPAPGGPQPRRLVTLPACQCVLTPSHSLTSPSASGRRAGPRPRPQIPHAQPSHPPQGGPRHSPSSFGTDPLGHKVQRTSQGLWGHRARLPCQVPPSCHRSTVPLHCQPVFRATVTASGDGGLCPPAATPAAL